MAARYNALHDGSRSISLLSVLSQYGDDGSRDNTSVSWAEFNEYDDFTVSSCLTLDNASCFNVTSADDRSTYSYSVWQVVFYKFSLKTVKGHSVVSSLAFTA